MAETLTVNAASEEIQVAAKRDLNFLGALAAPEEFIFKFPQFYLVLFSMLTSFVKNVERYAIGIPRGFAKTTFIKLLCLWYILFSHKKFILIVGASEGLAINTLSDICDLLSSDNIKGVFGDWKLDVEVDTQEQKVFYFRGRNIILRAIGAGTAVRGINRKNSRPDVIIMDDVQKREDAENPELAAKLLRWITGTLMKARSNSDCTYIYVGNMYPQNCILAKLQENTQWTSFIVGGILADGTSLWEELRPIEELLAEYQSDTELGQADIFISEVLNNTDITGAHGLDLTKVPAPPEYMLEVEGEASFIIIDPSSGKKDGDDCTIEHWTVVDGIPMMDHIKFGTFTPLETIKNALALGAEHGTRLICVEGVAYQSTLLFWFNYICEQYGISGFHFEELSPKGQNKNSRIKGGLIKLVKGELYVHPRVRSLVITQATAWNPATTKNKDDIIDPIGYVGEVMTSYSHLAVKQIFDVDAEAVAAAHTGMIQLPF